MIVPQITGVHFSPLLTRPVTHGRNWQGRPRLPLPEPTPTTLRASGCSKISGRSPSRHQTAPQASSPRIFSKPSTPTSSALGRRGPEADQSLRISCRGCSVPSASRHPGPSASATRPARDTASTTSVMPSPGISRRSPSHRHKPPILWILTLVPPYVRSTAASGQEAQIRSTVTVLRIERLFWMLMTDEEQNRHRIPLALENGQELGRGRRVLIVPHVLFKPSAN